MRDSLHISHSSDLKKLLYKEQLIVVNRDKYFLASMEPEIPAVVLFEGYGITRRNKR
jgi:hypothetical protein